MATREQLDVIERGVEVAHAWIMSLHEIAQLPPAGVDKEAHGMAQTLGGIMDTCRAYVQRERQKLEAEEKLSAWVDEQMTPTDGCECAKCAYLRKLHAEYNVAYKLSSVTVPVSMSATRKTGCN